MEKKANHCFECKNGSVFEEKVYCGCDGRFHPIRDDLLCKRFTPKEPNSQQSQIQR